MLHPVRIAPLFLEQLHHTCTGQAAAGGAEIPVVGRKAQQTVPDTAAHGVGRKTCPVQRDQQGGGTGSRTMFILRPPHIAG